MGIGGRAFITINQTKPKNRRARLTGFGPLHRFWVGGVRRSELGAEYLCVTSNWTCGRTDRTREKQRKKLSPGIRRKHEIADSPGFAYVTIVIEPWTTRKNPTEAWTLAIKLHIDRPKIGVNGRAKSVLGGPKWNGMIDVTQGFATEVGDEAADPTCQRATAGLRKKTGYNCVMYSGDSRNPLKLRQTCRPE